MQEIDLQTWERREHFDFFYRLDYPHFNISFNLDITGFLPYIKERNQPVYYSLIYYVMQAANKITGFRYRIRDGRVILHSRIHPSFTDMQPGQSLFKIYTVELQDNLEEFIRCVHKTAGEQQTYFPPPAAEAQDDLVYITCIPWISFTQLTHPVWLSRDDSVPRLSWGKYFYDHERLLLPFSIQLHHALADGYHAGLFKELLEQEINHLA